MFFPFSYTIFSAFLMPPSFQYLELDSSYLTLVIWKSGISAPSVNRREREAYIWKDTVVLWRFVYFFPLNIEGAQMIN